MTRREHLFLLETSSREVFRGASQIGVMSRNGPPGIIALISVGDPLNIKMESSSENHVTSWLDPLLSYYFRVPQKQEDWLLLR